MRQIKRALHAVNPGEPHAFLRHHLADDGRILPQRMRTQRFQHVLRRLACHAYHQFAFVGEIQRIQPEQLANAAHGGFERQRAFL